MGKATAQLQLYDSEKLAGIFRDFYCAVIDACEGLINWLHKSPAKHGVKVFFKQGAYGREVNERLDMVEKLATEIASQSAICSQQRLKYMEQMAERSP